MYGDIKILKCLVYATTCASLKEYDQCNDTFFHCAEKEKICLLKMISLVCGKIQSLK